jgi:hypothetical protein
MYEPLSLDQFPEIVVEALVIGVAVLHHKKVLVNVYG